MSAFAPLSAAAREALRTGHRARVVRHARLAPALPEDAAQMRFALEDALNTTDFSDCGRLIVVRRLRLRGLPRLAGSTLVAQALEEAWRALAPRAVAHGNPDAPNAEAVYFASRFEARLAWLTARFTGQRTDAWFWRAAVPELAQAGTQGEPARLTDKLVLTLVQESAGETMQALRELPEELLLALARELTDATGELLLAASTTSSDARAVGRVSVRDSPGATSGGEAQPAWPSVVTRIRRQATLQAFPHWLAAVWMSAERGASPSRTQVAALVAEAAARPWGHNTTPQAASEVSDEMQGESRASSSARPFAAASPPESGSSSFGAAVDTAKPRNDASAQVHPGNTQTGLTLPSDLPSARRKSPHAEHKRLSNGLPWLDNALPTVHGGLMLIVNVLQELRFESWLNALPEPNRQVFASALPLHILLQLQCARDEPQLAWFDGAAPAPKAVPMQYALRAWTLRMRRFLRRHTGIDLGALVQRPAWVCATATHADVIFPLDQTDLRLRRRGLDRDPGWVPWLGRIVSFHFLARELLPEIAPSPGFARPPERVQENLGAARRFLVRTDVP